MGPKGTGRVKPLRELRRIPLPRTRVNRPYVMREGLPVKAKRIHNSSYKVGAARAKRDRPHVRCERSR